MNFPHKGVYEGEFYNGMIQGHGKFVFKNGQVYVGDWKNNKMEGKGVLTYPSKKEYKGSFLKGLRWGQGSLRWPDGRRYEGGWKHDKQDGEGKFEFPTGCCKFGAWSKGMLLKWGESPSHADEVPTTQVNSFPAHNFNEQSSNFKNTDSRGLTALKIRQESGDAPISGAIPIKSAK